MLVVFKSNVSTQIPKIYKQTQTERVEDPKKKPLMAAVRLGEDVKDVLLHLQSSYRQQKFLL